MLLVDVDVVELRFEPGSLGVGFSEGREDAGPDSESKFEKEFEGHASSGKVDHIFDESALEFVGLFPMDLLACFGAVVHHCAG